MPEDELLFAPLNDPADPRGQPDTPEYDAFRRALDAKAGIDTALFPATSADGRITVRRTIEGIYFIRNNSQGVEVPIRQEDLDTLIPDLRGVGEDDSAMIVVNCPFLKPGTYDFDAKFHDEITNPSLTSTAELLFEHHFGLMRGCGLRGVISAAELNALFEPVPDTETR